ncbi:MAG: methylated-DNA--[protein]-cysteine S-methyltransferase [Candidatus Marinimicrobia bacterium]|nr:methylated-DNA--[protein]-cysteine S-methyltransferase [Candidatus Neomarinimicrobiota bacterium]MCF7903560.1 methylated-DNA--[protein]-cysteine S-methyltransferase [Candidatus Neomarinimicrobiota bacterium]
MTFHTGSMKTDAGPLCLASHGTKLCALTTGPAAERQLYEHLQRIDPDADRADSQQPLQPIMDQLNDYFSGSREVFEIPLYLKGTPFQETVWNELLTIPFGETITYAELANRLDNPGGIRAVGTANGRNPISIVVPCHRVIQTGGGLGGYAGGLAVKRYLLDHEAKETRPTLF